MKTGYINNQFTPESTIYLIKGVECDSMNNTYWGVFENQEDQFNFFINNFESIKFNDYTYQRQNGTVLVEKSFDEIRNYNYMVYRNGRKGNKSKWIYCFIKSIGYVSEEVSSIDFETDVMQTWRFEIEKSLLPSYVVCEHRGQYYFNEENKKYPCINTQPENLEIGQDLICNKVTELKEGSISNEIQYAIFVFSETIEGGQISTTISGIPSLLHYYIIPFDSQLPSSKIYFNNESTEIYSLEKMLDKIRNDSKYVGKCVNILVTSVITGLKVSFENNKIMVKSKKSFNSVNFDNLNLIIPSGVNLNFIEENTEDEIYDISIDFTLNQDIRNQKETKTLFYPYRYIMLTNNNGTQRLYKNELWEDIYDIKFRGLGSYSSSKINIVPQNYKIKQSNFNTSLNLSNSFEDGYELSLPIVTDQTAMLLQSSRNSMNVAISNTIRSNETSAMISSATGQAMSQQGAIQNNLRLSSVNRNNQLASNLTQLQNQSNLAGVGVSSLANIGGNLLSGNLIGALGSGLSGVGNMAITSYQNDIRNQMTSMQNANATANAIAQNQANSQSIGISNALRNLTTTYQNTTNLQNALDSYNAKIHDAQSMADSVATGSNDIYRIFKHGLQIPYVYYFQPTEEYQNKLENIFKVRGYMTNQYEKIYLDTRENWNYIQTEKINIKGGLIDPNDLEKIKMVFDNGITLWHTKDICDYSKNNNVRSKYIKLIDKFGGVKDE